MLARFYLAERNEWRETNVLAPPAKFLSIPVLFPGAGVGQLIFSLVAVEHGVAVYLPTRKSEF